MNDKMHGHAKITWPNGDVYEGDAANGNLYGDGKWTLRNGDVYEGEISNEKAKGTWIPVGKGHGSGQMTYSVFINTLRRPHPPRRKMGSYEPIFETFIFYQISEYETYGITEFIKTNQDTVVLD